MAKQSNKQENGGATPKRRSSGSKKIKAANKKAALAIGVFAALLISLAVAGIYAIKSDKDASSVPEKKATPPQAAVEHAEKKEPDNATQSDVKKDEEISALIRLVLFDHEISRSSVEERVSSTAGGKKSYFFNVKCYSDTALNVKEALRSVLTKQGYKVEVSGNKLTASSGKDSVQVAFIVSDPVQSKTDTPPKKANKNTQVQSKTETHSLPKPPAPAEKVVKMAILLDDGGNSYELAERFAKLKYPVAVAILPHLGHTKETAKVASAYGKTIFLHFPMQPKSYPSSDPGEGAALLSMPEILIDGVTKKNFDALGGVPIDGFNNHMGSAITEDRVKMAQIFKAAKNYTDTFIDSRTTAQSVAYDECVKANMRCGINKKFIDNDNDVNLIIERLYEAAELAKKNGEVLVIGHIRQKTIEALEIALPILESKKIAIVPLKTMVR